MVISAQSTVTIISWWTDGGKKTCSILWIYYLQHNQKYYWDFDNTNAQKVTDPQVYKLMKCKTIQLNRSKCTLNNGIHFKRLIPWSISKSARKWRWSRKKIISASMKKHQFQSENIMIFLTVNLTDHNEIKQKQSIASNNNKVLQAQRNVTKQVHSVQ